MDDVRPPRQPRPTPIVPARKPAQTQVSPATYTVPEQLPQGDLELELPPTSPISGKSIKRRLRLWPMILGAIVILILGSIGGVLYWYNQALQPKARQGKPTLLTIKSGTTPDAIATQLQQAGVIRSSLAFDWLMRIKGDRNKLQAGVYLFSPRQSTSEILQWLVDGKTDTFSITIPPGSTLADIKLILIADGFKSADVDAAFTTHYNSPLLATKPDSVNLDGYIYPDTYEVTGQTTVSQLLERTFDEFYQKIQENNILSGLQAKGFNLHQGITLASIISKEASAASDRRQIAEVFEKRLEQNISLGSDVTFEYAAKLTGQPASATLDSPYNTRLYKGLPPGAIGNFTIDVLEDVVNPAPGDYLFFVAGDDGTVHYATTEAEHQQNIQQYCKQLCSQ